MAFITTAAPHLGSLIGTRWAPLLRPLAPLIPRFFTESGRDVFFQTELMEALCSEHLFLKPLRAFLGGVLSPNR